MFIHSDEYKRLENIPISFHRAISYLNNHRAEKDDIALTLLYIDSILVAYRCLFSDYILRNKNKVKFAWISGSWVHPKYRRKAYSTKLLEHCMKINTGFLMFSNYAPESKALYDKSNRFTEVANLSGNRFYFRFSFSELLPPKHSYFKKIKPILSFSDLILNFFFDTRFYLHKINTTHIRFREIETVSSETHNFIKLFNSLNPFKRNCEELNHAIRFPWILENSQGDLNDTRYFFSSSAKRFIYKPIQINDNRNNITGFILLKMNNNALSIPYTFFEEQELNTVVKIILFYVKKYKISYLTTFNESINNELLKKRWLVLFSKKMTRKFFAGKQLSKHFSEKDSFFDGDGDNLYT